MVTLSTKKQQGDIVTPLGKKMRDFMLYTKEYAAQVNHPVEIFIGTMP